MPSALVEVNAARFIDRIAIEIDSKIRSLTQTRETDLCDRLDSADYNMPGDWRQGFIGYVPIGMSIAMQT